MKGTNLCNSGLKCFCNHVTSFFLTAGKTFFCFELFS